LEALSQDKGMTGKQAKLGQSQSLDFD